MVYFYKCRFSASSIFGQKTAKKRLFVPFLGTSLKYILHNGTPPYGGVLLYKMYFKLGP